MENYIIRHIEGGYMQKGCSGQWERTDKIKSAERMSYQKAVNVLQNCISPIFRNMWEIISESELVCEEEIAMTQPVRHEGFDWEKISQEQFSLYRDLAEYGKDLSRNLSEVDLEICDINHYIEFYSLDAAKGYKAYKMLKDRLKRRRHIKDEMERVNCFLASSSGDYSSGKIERQLKGMDLKRYTPRVLTELFGLKDDETALPHVS